MTVHHLKTRCWVIDPADEEWSAHYGLWAEAADDVAEIRADDPGSMAHAKALPTPCWVAECDGSCEELLGIDGNPLHCATRAEVLGVMRDQRWTVTPGVLSGDELVYCENDKPEDVELPPPSPAELEGAGQLRLPGVA